MILHFNLGQLLRTCTTFAPVFGYVSVTSALKAVYCIYFKPTPIGFTIQTRGCMANSYAGKLGNASSPGDEKYITIHWSKLSLGFLNLAARQRSRTRLRPILGAVCYSFTAAGLAWVK